MVRMVANTIVHLIHQRPLNGKECPGKLWSGLGEEYMIMYILLYMGKDKGYFPTSYFPPLLWVYFDVVA